MRILVAAMLALVSTAALAEGSSVGYENGGRFARFDPVVQRYNRTGELFRIDGRCQSACTLFLGIKNVCIGREARLLFHGGHKVVSTSATNHMLAAYKPRLRNYLVSNGYMKTIEFHTISGSDMIEKFGYRECARK